MAPSAALRPGRGLDLEEALKRWSDPAGFAAMREYWDARMPISVAAGVDPPPQVLRHQEYVRRRKPLEEALHVQLAAAELAASVLPDVRGPAISRDIVHPGLFHELEIAWDVDEFVGLHVRLNSPEIFDPRDIPLNVWDIPTWYRSAFRLDFGDATGTEARPAAPLAREVFRPSRNYRQVEFGDDIFALSVTQARMVRHLHEASRTGDRWVSTRDLLGSAHSESEKVAHVFRRVVPHWTRLIESNGKGMYRLRLEPVGARHDE